MEHGHTVRSIYKLHIYPTAAIQLQNYEKVYPLSVTVLLLNSYAISSSQLSQRQHESSLLCGVSVMEIQK